MSAFSRRHRRSRRPSFPSTGTFSGTTTINAGTLDIMGHNALPTNGNVVVNNGGTLITSAGHVWGTVAGTGTTTLNLGSMMTTANGMQSVIYRPLILNGGTLASGAPEPSFGSWRLGVPVYATADSIISATGVTLGGAIGFNVSPSVTLTASGVFRDDYYGGAGGLTKLGTGTMVLSGNNISGLTFKTTGYSVLGGILTGATTTNVITADSCVDANGAINSNGAAPFGTLAGKVLTIAAARMIAGADLTCTGALRWAFDGTLNPGGTGHVSFRITVR